MAKSTVHNLMVEMSCYSCLGDDCSMYHINSGDLIQKQDLDSGSVGKLSALTNLTVLLILSN